MIGTQPPISWIDNRIPVSCKFNDSYYSIYGGLEETNFVFLSGNNLPGRFNDGFHIAELGFGTGLNMLVSIEAFYKANIKGTLYYTSFEKYPLEKSQAERALKSFPTLNKNFLLDQWSQKTFSVVSDRIIGTVIIGDARKTVEQWSGKADAWFLDGFSPSKNPELWEPNLLKNVAIKTKKNGTFATYTAAGAVRRNLSNSGFLVEKVTGFGRKRHMCKGTLI
ncbi:MAG: tRNA (5-methylaminomethyl-2-thiouridine)(34)-methyltransferase MnmD [Rhodobacteraceae bacterium]|jgi:tRNA U34 5-methylaminomethyl-2-thiouridine-forming methyltransferase MnmC|nr:tRNA (5-methylaminomethyl-2-thiouridine)(34)-methyltransferase MnmD [Paracoccaceae bacterium]MDC0329202.1 tRNA (5-methylaminomethyl-2-thiouridine)(34)-methyltransferase MnmD [bacterium]MBT4284096.1 tRNA (5-methylaminomethyl-2-thiouridine)(34)-methyltransferase MnmD [Paracoccaceae bacterium]MBT4777721.1 tRNA (5-methylaminomethyl-2-thiouridine)(34)-methyltransferase MnmD [Paracoccaceae bacterium]MDG1299313.1 tRNA (5-methylaminomethyl-2-thiouridine)(34)-methyltransferase MnmD [Paracoccaceae bac|tara:strand:- start:10597 stop:11262 length:666 start_codon:yes stop_codon:yes gene_type:complete